MGERGRYRTKQQITILDVLKQQKSWFLTVDQLMDLLRQEGVQVGQTTVYRALERLAEDGKVMKLPMEDGSKIR
ncbi:MAG: transcriptional repressor, partial [Clostridium sp.]|nr:transcriptional repressor [Clostridium sp.]